MKTPASRNFAWIIFAYRDDKKIMENAEEHKPDKLPMLPQSRIFDCNGKRRVALLWETTNRAKNGVAAAQRNAAQNLRVGAG